MWPIVIPIETINGTIGIRQIGTDTFALEDFMQNGILNEDSSLVQTTARYNKFL